MTPFVVDASITLAWFFLDEATPYSAAVRARLRHTRAVAPAIWLFEVANAVVLARRRRRLTDAQADRVLRLLTVLPVDVELKTLTDIVGAVSSLAIREQLTVYDASYVDAAIRLGVPLATLDARMRAVAERLGGPLAEP